MTLKEKLKVRRFERYWKKQGRKDLFTWIYRYLRLHSELLDDSVYQEMFDYHRNTLIAYVKRDGKRKNTSDKEYGEMIDELADIFKELEDDVSIVRENGDLTEWAKRGLLLLNSILTVESGKPKSHQNIGWEEFTDCIIKKINAAESNRLATLGDNCLILWIAN